MSVMLIKNYSFEPKLIPGIFVMVLFAILLALGFWQIDRAQQKRHILQQKKLGEHNKSLSLQEIKQVDSSLAYQAITVAGRFNNKTQFLLDNKFHQHQVGYQVLTPLNVPGLKRVILINRGWIPMGKSRSILPTIAPVKTRVHLSGKIYLPAKKMMVLSDKADNPGQWPQIIQRVDFKKISQQLKRPVYPFVILLDKNQPHGFIRAWRAVIMRPAKHIGYAVQWFALAATLIILFVIANSKKRGTS